MVTAQEEWKRIYRKWATKKTSVSSSEWAMFSGTWLSNAAALERIVARQARTIEALQMQVWQLEAQEHNTDDGNEWEKETYLRGMHR